MHTAKQCNFFFLLPIVTSDLKINVLTLFCTTQDCTSLKVNKKFTVCINAEHTQRVIATVL